jgi:DNA-3-methyladenine glycosylase II
VAAVSKAKQAAKKGAANAPQAVDPHDHLSRADAKLAAVIARAGRCPLPERGKEAPSGDQAFRALVHAIVAQQLSGKAADTIFGRVEALGGDSLPGPAALLALSDETLRGAGLSGAKTRGVKDLAARVLDGSLKLDGLHAHEDEAVIEALTRVKGIGRWTAEMFLMFRLGRLDVMSTADLGLRKGMMHLFGLDDLPDATTMVRLSEHWRPYRSIGSWYLWRVAEEAPPLRRAATIAKKGAAKKGAAKKGAAKKTAAPVKAAAKKGAAKKDAIKNAAAPAKGTVAKSAATKKGAAKKKATPKRTQTPVTSGQAPAKKPSRAEQVLAMR